MDRSRIKLWLRLSLAFNVTIFAIVFIRQFGTTDLQTVINSPSEVLTGRLSPAQVEFGGGRKGVCGICQADPQLCEWIGEDNVMKAISYAGSNRRLRRALAKMQRGEPFNVAVIGGSVSAGHGLPTYPQQYAPTNAHRIIFDHLDTLFPGSSDPVIGGGGKLEGVNGLINGAQGGMGTQYFSYCWREHIPEDVDLVLLELAINDEILLTNQESYELLLRGLLELPSKPAIINLQIFALMFANVANGGDLHTGFAQFYDVPILSIRNALLPTVLANASAVGDWFIHTNKPDQENNMGGFDLRHLAVPGHKLLGDLVNAYIDVQLCEMEKYEAGTGETSVDVLYPAEPIPRMRLLQKYDPDTVELPLQPNCLSTNSEVHPLVPVEQEGWRNWNWEKKKYIIADVPGSKITFAFTTTIGKVQLFALQSFEFHLGTVQCWVDDETSKKVKIKAYWVHPFNIGRATTIQEGLSPGPHLLHCELLQETADPDGGHEFRIISVLSI